MFQRIQNNNNEWRNRTFEHFFKQEMRNTSNMYLIIKTNYKNYFFIYEFNVLLF